MKRHCAHCHLASVVAGRELRLVLPYYYHVLAGIRSSSQPRAWKLRLAELPVFFSHRPTIAGVWMWEKGSWSEREGEPEVVQRPRVLLTLLVSLFRSIDNTDLLYVT